VGVASVPAVEYAPDPGERFDSDAHRRLLGAVANPDEDPLTVSEIMARLNDDQYVPLDSSKNDEVNQLITDLVGDGYVKELKTGLRMTKEGRETLSAPPPEPEEEAA
jgi:hypothetical protein